MPSLFVFGDRDELVPVDSSVSIIRQTMTYPGHPAFSIVVFPAADHVISVATSGGGRTLAPGYLDTVADWLHRTVNLRRSGVENTVASDQVIRSITRWIVGVYELWHSGASEPSNSVER